MTAFLNVNGEPVLSILLRVPNSGPWWAELVMQDAPDIAGAVVVQVGTLEANGTIDARDSGTFSEQAMLKVVGGGGGWGTLAGPKHYHNDAGVKSRSIADDAARLAGETIGTFDAPLNVGIDYVRESGVASRVLEDAIAGVSWWVDFEGNTNVGARPAVDVDAGAYTVLEYDPQNRTATLAVEDFTLVGIGSTISEGLDEPIVVREIEIVADVESIRVKVWGGLEDGRGRLEEILRGIVARSTDAKLFGAYRYRVVQMSGDRVELQSVRAGDHPDVLPISMKPGVAGAHAEPAGSSIVLVIFIEGDRTLPVVTGFAGKDEEGHEATNLTFSVATELKLGSDSATEGATLGASHKTWADAHVHLHTDMGVPLFTSPPVTGTPVSPIPDLAPAVSTKVKLE